MAVARRPITTVPNQAERRLARLALDLGAATLGGSLSATEEALQAAAEEEPIHDQATLAHARASMLTGGDPLGEQLLRLRAPARRRAVGAFYTPPAIVEPMAAWAVARQPARVVDAGCGSGRFASAVVRRRPDLPVVAVDLDPLATLLTRAALAVLGATHASVLQADFTTLELPEIDGRTAWIGNPPYVRHHELTAAAKGWAARAGVLLGHNVSQLAGLHTYFFLATALQARSGDFGSYIVSAEWLDVGYGSVIRELLLDGLGGTSLHFFDAASAPFGPDVMSTAVIVAFEAGTHPEAVRLARLSAPDQLGDLAAGTAVPRATLAASTRWTPLFGHAAHAQSWAIGTAPVRRQRGPARPAPRLGDIARVHRGLVTGANSFFVLERNRARALGLEAWCRPTISEATEILDAMGEVQDAPRRRLLLCPERGVDRGSYPALDRYLRRGERRQFGQQRAIRHGYIASRRQPWWHFGTIAAPPIVASYMARRPPAFALNPDRLALLNIGHGLWPLVDMEDAELAELVALLNELAPSFVGSGRTYHGGLEKFEPSEMENLRIPGGERWLRRTKVDAR